MSVTLTRKPVGENLREFKMQDYRFHLETKEDDPNDPNSWIMQGYASTWDPDQVRDRIEPGAFAKTLMKKFIQAVEAYGYSDIPLFRDHCSNIGITINAKEDAKGLWVECKISKTTLGADTRQLLIDRAISRMSIGYYVLRAREEMDEETKTWTRVIEEIELLEVSVVTFPANDKARILDVKSRYGLEEKKVETKAEPAEKTKEVAQEMKTPAWLSGLKEWVDSQQEAKSLTPGDQQVVMKGLSLLGKLASKGCMDDGEEEEDGSKKPKPEACSEDLEALRRENPGTHVSGQDPDGKKSAETSPEKGEQKSSDNISQILEALRGFQMKDVA